VPSSSVKAAAQAQTSKFNLPAIQAFPRRDMRSLYAGLG